MQSIRSYSYVKKVNVKWYSSRTKQYRKRR